MLYTLTIILITIIAVLMVIVVLLQSGQGQGLSGGIAGGGGIGGGGNMMGARRTADFLSKSTTVLASIFLTLCVLANFFIDQETVSQSTIQQQGIPTEQSTDFDAPAPLPEQQSQDAGDLPLPVETDED
ncbi:preprotein translocase subunit SecG [Balneolaceae bacterium ANBcel3]|nr:preprotein translocase subunit SecG [Balneolaceae bacterium ANBcel3]